MAIKLGDVIKSVNETDPNYISSKVKTLYIIRGLPGSGKSTLAHELANYFVCEADQYFTSPEGNYLYDKEKIGQAHHWCQDKAKYFMQQNHEVIAVSNTFVKRWEIAPYIKLAQEYGYRIVEITMSGDTYGNLHNVPDEVITRMRKEWEK